jgi:hypothetical protein
MGERIGRKRWNALNSLQYSFVLWELGVSIFYNLPGFKRCSYKHRQEMGEPFKKFMWCWRVQRASVTEVSKVKFISGGGHYPKVRIRTVFGSMVLKGG